MREEKREREREKKRMSTNLASSFWGINANSNKPSIFELILMEQLDSAFYPAYEFLIQVISFLNERKRA